MSTTELPPDRIVSTKKVTLAVRADSGGRQFHYISAGAEYETYPKKGETVAKAQARADKLTTATVTKEVEKLVKFYA